MLEDLSSIQQWGKWAVRRYESTDFRLRECLDGDLLQVFAALVKSGLYKYNWSDDVEAAGSNDGSNSSDPCNDSDEDDEDGN